MNEIQAKKLAEELAKKYTIVSFETSDGTNYEVTVRGGEKAVPPIPNCDICKNHIICLVYRKIIEVMPIVAMATLNPSIGDYVRQIVSKECKRFQR